jgi:hypothetical protein
MHFLHVFFVAAGNNDGWKNNLFFIALAAFWIIGAIVKAIGRKSGKEQATPQQSQEKPFEPALSFLSKTIAYSQKMMNIQSPPATSVVHEKAQLMEQAAMPSQAFLSEEKEPIAQEMPFKEKKKIIDISSKALIKFDSASEIRRAIVYYEILGKPISLRDYPFYD